jgi:hypothetical protein
MGTQILLGLLLKHYVVTEHKKNIEIGREDLMGFPYGCIGINTKATAFKVSL